MKIPTPNEFAEQHGHNPFPPRWEKWLSAVREGILSAQPVAGRNVSTDEHIGKGTVINVERRPGGGATGACCIGTECSITTEAACTEAGGIYQGDDILCDPNPCETPPCVCTRTIDISVTFTVDDTESGCDFHASRTETLVSSEIVDLCAYAWGPFEFLYPEYSNGQIFINAIGVGLSGPDPPPICFFSDGICGVFSDAGCGSGYFCFNINDAYYTGDDPCFAVCDPPSTITLSWVLTDGLGFTITATVTINIS